MKEFQAENERRRTITENSPTTLLSATSNELILQSISNDPSQNSSPSTPNKQFRIDQQIKTPSNRTKINTPERRSNLDRNKLNLKTNKMTSDTLKVRLFSWFFVFF
jgi:hypothetical protein